MLLVFGIKKLLHGQFKKTNKLHKCADLTFNVRMKKPVVEAQLDQTEFCSCSELHHKPEAAQPGVHEETAYRRIGVKMAKIKKVALFNYTGIALKALYVVNHIVCNVTKLVSLGELSL